MLIKADAWVWPAGTDQRKKSSNLFPVHVCLWNPDWRGNSDFVVGVHCEGYTQYT